LNTKIVTTHSYCDPVTGVFKDKLIGGKEYHDPVAFAAVKSDVAVSLLPPPPSTTTP
jgi:hypothetical protein